MKTCARNCVLLGWLLATPALADKPPMLVSASDAGRHWTLTAGEPLRTLPYPAPSNADSPEICVSLGYRITSDGATSDFVLLASTSGTGPANAPPVADAFVQAVATTVAAWRYAPTHPGETAPIYTSATMAFAPRAGADVDAIRRRCAIADLRDFVARTQAQAYRRGTIGKSQLDQSRIELENGTGQRILDDFVRGREAAARRN